MHLLLNFSHVQSFFTMLKCLTIILVLMLNQSTTTGSIYGPRPRIRNYSKDELVIMRKELERLLKEVEHSNLANKEENSKDHVAIAGEQEPVHKDFMELSTSANREENSKDHAAIAGEQEPAHKDFMELSTLANREENSKDHMAIAGEQEPTHKGISINPTIFFTILSLEILAFLLSFCLCLYCKKKKLCSFSNNGGNSNNNQSGIQHVIM
jgi:hypothetical protein